MIKKLSIFLISILAVTSLRAGNVTTYPAVSSVADADLFFDWQSSAQKNATALQMKSYMLGGGSAAIATGKTLTVSNSLTFTGTDGSSVAFGSGGAVLYSLGIGSLTEAWSAKLDKLAALSAPGTAGYLLSSDTSGNLSWQAPTILATASGTNTYTATPSPALAAYGTGLGVLIKFTNANTGGCSLNLNSLGAIPIQQNGAAVAVGAIPANVTLHLIYDGTNFQIVGNGTTYGFSTGLVLTGNVVTVSTNLATYSAQAPNSTALAALGDAPDATGGLLSFAGIGTITEGFDSTILKSANIGSSVQAYNSSLAAIASGTYTGATSITTLGTIATGTIPWANLSGIPTTRTGYGIAPTMTSNTTSTITFNTSGNDETIYNPSASTLSAATLTLPTTAGQGERLTYQTHGIITTLTTSGQTVDGWASPTSMTADSSIVFQCESANGHFVRVK